MVRSLVAAFLRLGALLVALTLPLSLAAPARAAWDTGGTLVAEPNSILAPSFASNGSGGVYAFWTAGFTQMPGTMVLGDGTHPAAWPLAGTEFMAGTRKVSWTFTAPDGAGGAYVAGTEAFLSWTGARPYVIGRVLADATRAPGWPDTGLVVADTPHAKVLSRLLPDGAGGALLVWLDAIDFGLRFSDYGTRYEGVHEVRALRIAPDGTLAPGWPAAGVAVTTAPPGAARTTQLALKAVADGAGGVFMAWADSLDGVGDVYLQRLDGTGAIASGWPVGGRAVAATSRQRFLADLIPDGAGGLLVSWSQYAPPTHQGLVTRIDGAGATASGWPADGVSLCPTCDYPSAGPLVTDGAGGALVGFQDIRLPGMEDLFITRVLGNGILDGPTGGMPIATTTDGEVFQDAVSDGAQGGYFLWASQGFAGAPQDDLYATHLTSAFALPSGWPAGGVLVSDRPGRLAVPARLLPDGAGGATAAWYLDPDVGVTSAYALRLPNASTDVSPVVVAGGAVLALAPNPSSGATHISLALPRAGRLRLDVFDVSGRLVRALDSGALLAGKHTRAWDGRGDDGALVPAGLYLVRVRGEGLDATARVVRMR